MDITDGAIEYQTSDGINYEKALFTYDEEEKQNNEINKANAKLIFSPKFIPIYPELLDKLTLTEALLFGFIDFYKSNSSGRFYFTNEQLAGIIHCNPDTISRAIKSLEDKLYISTSRKMKANGGLIRFVNDILYNRKPTNYQLAVGENINVIDNKINNNNINNISSEPKKNSSEGFDMFWKEYPHTHKGKKKEARKYFEKVDTTKIMYELKFINRLIIFGFQDPKFMPACERWVRDFTPTADIVKEQNIKKIVNKIMQMDIGDKRKEYADKIKSDFGESIINKYVKEWNNQTNSISLKFNK